MSPELRYHNILVTLDGSPEAETALPHAMAITAQFNATVTLLRVADAPTGWFVSPTDAVPLIEMEREASVDYLESLARYWANGAPAIRVAHQAGAAAESIVQYARSTAADLVVMSTRGRGGIARLLLGSVAHAVQRKAPCPILLVPSSARPRGERHAEYGRVLLALDGSSEAELAVAHALALARRFHAAVTVVRPVVSAVAVGTSHGPGPHPRVVVADERVRASIYLEDIAARFREHGVQVDQETLHGRAADGLARRARVWSRRSRRW